MSEREIAGMKRYDLEPCQHGGFMIIEATAAEDGKWALASDAAAAVQEALRAGPQPPPPNQGPTTMEETIPEEVREAAIRAVYATGFPGGDLPSAVLEADILAIVRVAIMAERERCAKVAEAAFDLRDGLSARVAASKIATSIRSGV